MRFVDQYVETKVQILDVNSDPVTSATVNFTLYDQNDEEVDLGQNENPATMTHVGRGVYTAKWKPGQHDSGHWTAICSCTNPKFQKSFTYYIRDEGVTTRYGYSPGIYTDNSTLQNNTNEQNIPAQNIGSSDTLRKTTIIYDMHLLTQQTIIRKKISFDGGATYLTFEKKTYPDDFIGAGVAAGAMTLEFPPTMLPILVSFQSVVGEGTTRLVSYYQIWNFLEETSTYFAEAEENEEPD